MLNENAKRCSKPYGRSSLGPVKKSVKSYRFASGTGGKVSFRDILKKYEDEKRQQGRNTVNQQALCIEKELQSMNAGQMMTTVEFLK